MCRASPPPVIPINKSSSFTLDCLKRITVFNLIGYMELLTARAQARIHIKNQVQFGHFLLDVIVFAYSPKFFQGHVRYLLSSTSAGHT